MRPRATRGRGPVDANSVMFAYWGRRGALTHFIAEAARAALADSDIRATVSISRQNEKFDDLHREFGKALLPVDTFSSDIGAVASLWRARALRRRLLARLAEDRIVALIDLMPHIWSPLIAPSIARAGIRYLPVIHDAVAHPGDRTSLAKYWTDRSMLSADRVLTLSAAVADRLSKSGWVSKDRIVTLFHPDYSYRPTFQPHPPAAGEALRLLFLGRIMPYKGLPLFLDAADLLRQQGIPVYVGVFGEGSLGNDAARLAEPDAEVCNRWLSEEELGDVLSRYHAVVLSHIEASQSGVAATAIGAGLPVVATPVGGLREQVIEGKTGTMAERADAGALADAIKRLMLDPSYYRSICRSIAATREQRSMARFVRACMQHATGRAELGE